MTYPDPPSPAILGPPGDVVVPVAGLVYRSTPLAFVGLSGGRVLATDAGIILGWSLREASGTTAADVSVYDGSSTGGQALAHVHLAASASDVETLYPAALPVRVGLFVDVAGSTADGVVWYGLPIS